MALIEGLNYVEGLINNEILSVPPTTNTFNSTLVLGTSAQGKNQALTKVTFADMEDQFGPGDNVGDFDTSLSHAVFAILASTADTNKDMYVYKVGDAAKASATFYEVQTSTTGDTSFSFIDGNPVESITFEGVEESSIANDVIIQVNGDSAGLPYSVIITLPTLFDNYTATFFVDPYGTGTGSNNVLELADAINADTTINQVLQASITPLRIENHAVTMDYTDANPKFDVEPIAINESWGDKLLNIESIKEDMPAHVETSTSGGSSRLVTYAPDKDSDEGTVTIDTFRRLSVETAATGDSSNLTEEDFVYNLGLNIPNENFTNLLVDIEVNSVTHITAAGTETVIPLFSTGSADVPEDGTYGINSATPGTDPFLLYVNLATAQAMQPNDRIIIDYKYTYIATEANLRSELVLGDKNSYFVAGNEVVFGSSPGNIEMTYDAVKTFAPSDYNIIDATEIEIEFIGTNRPISPADNVSMTFTYLPELPAPSDTVINDSTPAPYVTQVSGLSSGTAGNLISKKRYKELVEEAFENLLLTPFRRIMVAGAFLNDTVDDIDYETGLPGTFDLGWGAMLSQKLDLKSRISGECTTVLGVKPIGNDLISQGVIGYNQWIEELTINTTDALSPAAIINGLDSMYIDVALGAMMVQNGNILNSQSYLENPAYVLCGMQLDSSLEQSIIAQTVPPFVKSLLYGFPSGYTIGKLNLMRYTSFVLDVTNTIVIADAPTCDGIGKQFNRQLVRDTVFTATRLARTIASEFVGKRRNTQMLGIMQNKVNKTVNGAMTPKYLSSFNAEVVPVAGGHISGATKLRLFMGTSVEIRNVYLETSVKLEGEDI